MGVGRLWVHRLGDGDGRRRRPSAFGRSQSSSTLFRTLGSLPRRRVWPPRLTRTRSIRCMGQGPNLYEVLGRVELPAG